MPQPYCGTCSGTGRYDPFETGRDPACPECCGSGRVSMPEAPTPQIVYRLTPEAEKTIAHLQDQLRRRDLDVNELEMELEREQMKSGRLHAMLVERGHTLPVNDPGAS